MVAEHKPSTWKTRFCWQRGGQESKGGVGGSGIDAMLRAGLVFPFLTIPSQDRPGEPFSPCNRGHCASPRARAACSRKGILQMGHE